MVRKAASLRCSLILVTLFFILYNTLNEDYLIMRSLKTLFLAIFAGIVLSLSVDGCSGSFQVTPAPADSLNAYWNGFWRAYYLNANDSLIIQEIQKEYDERMEVYLDEIGDLRQQVDSLENLPIFDQGKIDSLNALCDAKVQTANQLANSYWKQYYSLLCGDSTYTPDTVFVTKTDTIFKTIVDTLIVTKIDTVVAPPVIIVKTDTLYKTVLDTVVIEKIDTVTITEIDTIISPPQIIVEYDTVYISTIDTLVKVEYDTVYVPQVIEKVDTLWRTIYDTTYITQIDTVVVTEVDTVYETKLDTLFIPYLDTVYVEQGGVALKPLQTDIEMDSVRMILAPVYKNQAIAPKDNYYYKKSDEYLQQYNFLADSLLIYQIGDPVVEPVPLYPIATRESDSWLNNGNLYDGSKTIDGIDSEPCQDGQWSLEGCDRTSRYVIEGYPHWIEYEFENTYQFTEIGFDVYFSERGYVHAVKIYADGEFQDSIVTKPDSVWSYHEVLFTAKNVRLEFVDIGPNLPAGLQQNAYLDVWEVSFKGRDLFGIKEPMPIMITGATATANAETAFWVFDDTTSANYSDINSGRWAAQPMPQSVTVELLDTVNVVQVHTNFFHWDEGRIYQYKIETSIDGLIWENVTDTIASRDQMWSIVEITPRPAKYVRITCISNNIVNSAGEPNTWANIWEIKVFREP